MPLHPGTTLGPYSVTAKIGEGGMGEVYRARDTKLDRDVALKVLPQAFTDDPDRLARFEREAKVLASLNHPNIGHIYGLEEAESQKALVLELIEGPTLADRIKQGPIPVDEALPIAKQIAEALEAAHEQGIIHRDLKPANIKVKDDGTVKVLDFGLAKAFQPEASDVSASMSPTISLTAAATQMGMVIGTAAYMAPEQAKGKVVDKRADVWAFGAVLYEMLTGQKPFVGDDVSDTLAAVLRADVDLDVLPNDTLPRLRQVIRACLQRDRKDRVQAMGDVRLLIDGAFEASSGGDAKASQPTTRHLIPWTVAVVMSIVAVSALLWPLLRPEFESAAGVTRFEIPMPLSHELYRGGGASIALTPDGRSVVYIGIAADGRALYRRPLDELSAVVIPGTEGSVSHPAVSPDGSMLAFFRSGQPALIELTGGSPRTLSDIQVAMGVTWADDSTLVLTERAPNIHLSRVSATGGEPVTLVSGEGPAGTGYNYPHMLPGGSVLVYTVWGGNVESAQVAARSLTTGDERVLWEGSSPHLTTTGHLLFARDNDIWAAAFNSTTLEAIGEPVRVVEDVQVNGGGLGLFAASANGTLVYVPGGVGTQRSLVWVDRSGREEALNVPPGEYTSLRLSPDGLRVALTAADLNSRRDDVWLWDITRSALTRLTSDAAATDTAPVWTTDGRSFVFASDRDGAMQPFLQSADGAQQAVPLSGGEIPQAFVDSETLLVQESGPAAGTRLATIGLESDDYGNLLEDEAVLAHAAMSTNGEWLAYQSNESGQFEIYVRPYPDLERQRFSISAEGGTEPVWSRDGDELFFRELDGQLMSVQVQTQGEFVAGEVRPLVPARYTFSAGSSGRQYDLSPDGDRFLMIKEGGGRIVVVENWYQELLERVPIP